MDNNSSLDAPVVSALDAELDPVRQLMVGYFTQINQIATTYPPVGINAANGWIQKKMIDPAMDAWAIPPILTAGSDADKIFQAYSTFYQKCKAAFGLRTNYTATPEEIALIVIEDIIIDGLKDDLTATVKDILKLTTLDVAAIASIVSDVVKLVEDLQNLHTTVDGTHLNGWIAVDLKKAADDTVNKLNIAFPVGTATDAGKMADTFRTALQKLSALSKGLQPSDDGSVPWQRSEWEVSYQAIASTLATALENL